MNKNIFKINILYFITIMCLVTVFSLAYFDVLTNDLLATFLIQIMTMLALPLLLYTLLISKNYKTTLSDCGINKINGKMILISLVLGVLLYFLNTFVAASSQAIISLFGWENIYSSTTVELNTKFLLKEFLLSAVLPAVCEEIFHRGIMLFANKKTQNTRYCLVLSSILFGLTHLNINQFFYTAILGMFIGYVALVSDSIIPAMIIHFCNNFLATYFAYGKYLNLPLAQLVATIEEIILGNFLYLVFSAILGTALIIYLYIYLTKKLFFARLKMNVMLILNQMQKENLSLEETQERIYQVNQILNKNKKFMPNEDNKIKASFNDNIFLISGMILTISMTIFSFIWGII